MFEELYAYLGTRDDVGERIICLPSLERLQSGQSDQLAERLLSLGATITAHPAARPVDVTFIADTVAGLVRGCGVVANVGHGTISKGYYFTDSVWTERENWVDLLCVPGAYAAERFKPLLRTRVVATGMPKLDPVFAGRHSREALCRQLQIDPARRIVLYAPTFNEDLSSAHLFADRFAELAAPDRTLLIKLHGSTLAPTIDAYRALATRTPGIVFVDDPNIAASLGGADVMISDVSSVFMEFMALDKPVILFDHPQMQRYHGYNPDDIEHAWRDLATRTDSFDATKAALDDVLSRGDERSAVRQRYAAQLFADRSGRASAQVWQATLDTIDAVGPPASRPPLVPTISLLVQLTPDNLFLVRRLLGQAQFFAVMPIELRVVQMGSSPELERYLEDLRRFGAFAGVHVTTAADGPDVDRGLTAAARAAIGEYVMFVRPNVVLHRGFDYFLHKTFLHHPDVQALTPLSTTAGDSHRTAYEREPLDGAPDERAAYQFINWHRGETIGEFKSPTPPPVVIVRAALVKHLSASFLTGLAGLANSGHLKVAASVYCALMPGAAIKQALDYLRAPPAERPTLALDVLKSGIFAVFPDVAMRLLTDLMKVGATGEELEPVLAMATRGIRGDVATLKSVRAIVARLPTLAKPLEVKIALVERFVEAVSRQP